MKPITEKEIKVLQKEYDADTAQLVLRRALNRTSLVDIAHNMESCQNTVMHFSIDIPTLPVANQRASGRCWIFAGLNILREVVAKKCGLSKFELSQNYISFCDKLEKSNYYLETIIELIDSDYDDRVFSHMTSTPIQDGGQWDMFVSLIQKYGVMPQEAFPETFQSSNTMKMNQIINNRLRKFTAKAKKLHSEGKDILIRIEKDQALKEIYNLLNSCFGRIPEKFKFEYTDKNKQYHCDDNLTPKAFYDKYVGINLDDYVSVINAPTDTKPFMKSYTVQHLGNVVGGKQIHYLNLDIKDFKSIVFKQLQNNELVWFGCDSGKSIDRANGIWDDESFSYEEVLGMDLHICKGCALNYHESAMGHAMVLTGVNIYNGKPNRWKVENSWGESSPAKGYYVMTDTWFDKYVYQAVVNKKYLNQEQLKAWAEKPIELKPWDPMGTLAE